MEPNKDLTKMSNAELKLYINSLTNTFESLKKNIKTICEELVDVEKEYNRVNNEINTRKTAY